MKEDYTWFDKPENKGNIDFPVAMVYSPTTNTWTVACDEDINPYLPEHLFGYGTGKTKEEAIRNMFANINIVINYHIHKHNYYRKRVPLLMGKYWIEIFGIHISFKYRKGMMIGTYIPYTKLNISIHNGWKNKQM